MLEHALELLVVADAHDHLEAEVEAALGEPVERVVVLVVDRQHDRRGRALGSPLRCRAVGEERQRDLAPQTRVGAADDDALGAALLRAARRVAAADLDEHRDAVSLCNRLAQPPVGHGARC